MTEEAYEKGIYSNFHEFAHGYVFIPILVSLQPILLAIKGFPGTTLEHLCKKHCVKSGPLGVILGSLEGLELLEIRGNQIYPTKKLEVFLKIPSEISKLYQIEPISYLKRRKEAFFSPYFKMVETDWPKIQDKVLKKFLNGALFLPLLIGLYQMNRGNLVNEVTVSLKGICKEAQAEILFFFCHFGLVSSIIGEKLELTRQGLWVYQNVLNYSLGF